MKSLVRWLLVLLLGGAGVEARAGSVDESNPLANGRFRWQASDPLIDVGPGRQADDPQVSIKDPTVLFHEGRWHVFATVRMKSGKVDMQYLNFADWSQANQAERHALNLHDQYHCAPHVFYFTPQRKWYLVYQLADKTRTPPFGPCFSTTDTLTDPRSWSRQQAMVTNAPAKPKWLDFWVICDATKAHLFYTSLDGRMWRRETRKADFPFGWSEPQLALQGDIFEASHTYKLKGLNQYLTVVEAQGGGGRYYKAYLADRLEGPWKGIADSWAKPFASRNNVTQTTPWTASISHGELIRTGVDETMEVDPANLRFVFQGVSDEGYKGKGYGGIPWRLGILEPKKQD
ncbi:MAG: non-reducing end alpha-L-arabinofuranosidase family hydrolase [Verrucomicrobiota bacterium]